MKSPQNCNIVASIITADYISQAITAFWYLQESNPQTSYYVLIIGKRDNVISHLPCGPVWIFWEELLEKSYAEYLASQFTPFELCCVVRGRLHAYLGQQDYINKWILIDTDIAVLSSLQPLWQILETCPIVLTPHSNKPIVKRHVIPHESNMLSCGIYNGGVVGMRKSSTASKAADWMIDRFEAYGHSHRHRLNEGLMCMDFEFVDQIWLNLVPLYFPETGIIRKPEYNLGHWNLVEGELIIRDDQSYFDGRLVVMAHFSGLPEENLETVSKWTEVYKDKPSQAWALLASKYLINCSLAEAGHGGQPYCYQDINPNREHRINETNSNPTPASAPATQHKYNANGHRSVQMIANASRKINGYIKLATWKASTVAKSLARRLNRLSRIEHLIFGDHSKNGFTGLTPCIGNYETYLVRAWILNAVESAKPFFHGKLLDVGAGSSPYQDLIMASGKVSDYIKLDFASSDYHQGNELDLTWDGKTIPLAAGSVDTVFMTEVLEHVHKPAELLREVRRVLKPRGVLFLTVPFSWPMHELPFDYHRFTPIAMRAYLEEADFAIKDIKLLGGWDHSFALQIGLWLTNASMGERKRKIAKLLAWPIYSHLIRKGENEFTRIRNHQMYIGLAVAATAGGT
jgi:SAM-dependent methyltransferase